MDLNPGWKYFEFMKDYIITDFKDKFSIIIIAVVFVIFMSFFSAYSALRYKEFSRSPLIKSHVEMKIIDHNVKSVCPKCGFRGTPKCPDCMVFLYWNGYQGSFICPSCGKGGFPQCSKCNSFMTWIESR